jgi:hypothetical protein
VGLTGQRLEPQCVDLVVPDAQHVPGVLGDEHPGRRTGGPAGFQHPAQMGDVGLHRRDGRGRRLVPPQQVDQPVHRDHMPGIQHEDRQQRALQPRANADLLAVAVHPERAQHSKAQAAVTRHLGPQVGRTISV